MRNFIAIGLGAGALAACATAPTHMNQNSISFRYDALLDSVKTLQPKADAHCAKYGKTAKLAADWSAEGIGLRRATFDCL